MSGHVNKANPFLSPFFGESAAQSKHIFFTVPLCPNVRNSGSSGMGGSGVRGVSAVVQFIAGQTGPRHSFEKPILVAKLSHVPRD